MADYDVLARRCRLATWLSMLALLVVIALDALIMPSNGRSPNVVVWLALTLPLLIFVPGMRRGSINSFAWLGFVSLLYFAQGVTALFVPWRRLLDVLYLLLAIALFVSAMLSVRYTARAKRVSEQ